MLGLPGSAGAGTKAPYTDTARTATDLALLTAVALLFCWPVLWHGAPDLANDTIYHARWTKSFAVQFWAGEWYPRWMLASNAGYGSPLFFFYPPLASFVSALVAPVYGAADPEGWRIVGCSCALAMILSGITSYFWLRRMAGARAAIFGSIIYLLLPYHTAINLYNRGAFAEFWAFVWLPLVMLSVDRLRRGKTFAVVEVAGSYSLLVFTHLLITLTFSLVPVAAAFFLADRERRWRDFVKTSFAMALGGGIAAIFLLPAMLDQHKAYFDLNASDWFQYSNWFIFQRLPSLLHYNARILFVTVSTFVYTMVLILLSRKHYSDHRRSLATFYGCVGLVTFLFTTQVSAPLWAILPYLKFLQFPSRFNAVLALAAAAASALAFPVLAKMHSRTLPRLIGILLIVWVAADAWSASAAFSAWRTIPKERAKGYREDMRLPRDAQAFWPKPSRASEFYDFAPFERYVALYPPRSVRLGDLQTGKPLGTAAVVDWKPRKITLKIDAPYAGRLTVNHFYYAGWSGRIEGKDMSVAVVPSHPDGFLQMDIPPGTYHLAIELQKDRAEQWGTAVSFASAAAAFVISLAAALRRRRAQIQPLEQ